MGAAVHPRGQSMGCLTSVRAKVNKPRLCGSLLMQRFFKVFKLQKATVKYIMICKLSDFYNFSKDKVEYISLRSKFAKNYRK